MPVGVAAPAPPGGTLTTSDCGTPVPSYSVDLFVPASLTHTKAAGLNATPHAFTRFASANAPCTGLPAALLSTTRFVIAYAVTVAVVLVVGATLGVGVAAGVVPPPE